MNILFEVNPQCSYISTWEDLEVNNTKLKPSIIEPPQLELKQLPEHLNNNIANSHCFRTNS